MLRQLVAAPREARRLPHLLAAFVDGGRLLPHAASPTEPQPVVRSHNLAPCPYIHVPLRSKAKMQNLCGERESETLTITGVLTLRIPCKPDLKSWSIKDLALPAGAG
jgi:hypothetical protein